MSVLEVLVGGGLALAGSVGGQLYAARRERQRDEAAAAAARVERRRSALLELHVAMEQLVVQGVLARKQGGDEAVHSYGLALGRAHRAMSLTPDNDLREQAIRALAFASAEAPDAQHPDHPSRVIVSVGERLRQIDGAPEAP